MFQIFEKSLQQLKTGVPFSELTKEYVPRTAEEEPIVIKRMELTKEKLYEKMVRIVHKEFELHPEDEYLSNLSQELRNRNAQSYNRKSDLMDSLSTLEQYVSDLKSEAEFVSLFDQCASEDDSDEEEARLSY